MFKLSDALSVIANKPEFKVHDYGTYAIIDYMITPSGLFVGKDEFETKILQNLRGTAFDKESGNIISLPFHKFHNYGETTGYMPHELNDEVIASVSLKEDGSMIRPIPVGRDYVLGTRAGVTDVSRMAESMLTPEIEIFIRMCLAINCTPIFEFCSRKNKVVVDYPNDKLVLLAMRHNNTGEYFTYKAMQECAAQQNITLVNSFDSSKSLGEFQEMVKVWLDLEGVVVTLQSGKMVKMKAEDYCLRHGVIDIVKFEKDVLRLHIDSKLDDIKPLIEERTRERIEKYTESVNDSIRKFVFKMKTIFEKLVCNSQKEFAAKVNSQHKQYSAFLFKYYGNHQTSFEEIIIEHVSKNTGSSTRVENIREIIGTTYYNF